MYVYIYIYIYIYVILFLLNLEEVLKSQDILFHAEAEFNVCTRFKSKIST